MISDDIVGNFLVLCQLCGKIHVGYIGLGHIITQYEVVVECAACAGVYIERLADRACLYQGLKEGMVSN